MPSVEPELSAGIEPVDKRLEPGRLEKKNVQKY